MKKNLLITTGGSGGHVLPAMILHEHLSKNDCIKLVNMIPADIKSIYPSNMYVL